LGKVLGRDKAEPGKWRVAFGMDAENMKHAALGMDDFDPSQPRVGKGGSGAGEWTAEGGGSAPSKPKKAQAPKKGRSSSSKSASSAGRSANPQSEEALFGNTSFRAPPPAADPIRRYSHEWSQREGLFLQMIEGNINGIETAEPFDHDPTAEELDALVDQAQNVATKITRDIFKTGNAPERPSAEVLSIARKFVDAENRVPKLYREAKVRYLEKDAEQPSAVPPELFHGTATSVVGRILKEGIEPSGENPTAKGADEWAMKRGMHVGNLNVGDRAHSVYMATDKDVATQFALYAADNFHAKPAVLKITIPADQRDKLHYDELSRIGELSSPINHNAFRFVGKIPPEWITQVTPSDTPMAISADAADGDLVIYLVILTDGGVERVPVDDGGNPAMDAFNSGEPRDEKGEWTNHGSFTLFHGSKFGGLKKFDASKIGTGEGFAAYGSGFYLARNQKVAESYRDAGDDMPDNAGVTIGGKLNPANKMSTAERYAYRNWVDYGSDLDKAIADLGKRTTLPDGENPYKKEQDAARKVLLKWKGAGATVQKGGNVYTVEAKADPASFLDWDEPIGKQSAAVLKALFPDGLGDGVNKTTPTGQFYTSLISARGGQGAAKELMKAGVPGVRYLDEGSRTNASYLHMIATSRANWVKLRDNQPPSMVKRFGKMDIGAWHKHVDANIAFWDKELAGLGEERTRLTRNYVVFDPKTLSVTHRNGVPLDGGASDTILAGDDFNPSEPRKNDGEWTDGGPSSLSGKIISSRNVTAKRAQGHDPGAYKRVDTQAMKADQALYKHNVDLFKLARFYPGMRADEVKGSTDEIASHVINRMRENLDYIRRRSLGGRRGFLLARPISSRLRAGAARASPPSDRFGSTCQVLTIAARFLRARACRTWID
jgi:hypothetical protein